MGVTGKGNYKRGQEEQGEDLLGKETDQKSEARSGGWAETGREERRNQFHTKPGMKLRCLKAVIPLLPAGYLGKPTRSSATYPTSPTPSSACADLAKNNPVVALSWLCYLAFRGLPVAEQNIPALLMIHVGVSEMPGHGISAFSVCSFKNRHKTVE